MRSLVCVLICALGVQAAALRVGTGTVKITPPQGAAMAGYYVNRTADGVHDDLWAKALVFETDGQKAALVACDIIGIPREIIDPARKQIETATGIPGARVMISATHAHTGPVILAGRTRYNLEGDMLRITKQYAAD